MFASLKKAKDDLDREKVRRERVSFDKTAPPPSPYKPDPSIVVGSATTLAPTATRAGSILKPAPV
eukprot:3423314-Prorocentrum_lima.AAC.1